MNDEALSVYNKELIKLSAEVEEPHHLTNPNVSAKAISPICGSEVTVELKLNGETIEDFGYELEACALTRAVVAIIKNVIKGKSRNDIAEAAKEMELMLSGNDLALSEDWGALKIFLPVVEYKSRHNSILLPFKAIEKAFKQADLKEKI